MKSSTTITLDKKDIAEAVRYWLMNYKHVNPSVLPPDHPVVFHVEKGVGEAVGQDHVSCRIVVDGEGNPFDIPIAPMVRQ